MKPNGYGLEMTKLRPGGNQTCQLDKLIVTLPVTGKTERAMKQNRVLLVDDEIFNLLAQKNILKQAEKNIVSRICK